MKNRRLVLTLVLPLVGWTTIVAQVPAAAKFSGDASSVFEVLAPAAGSGYFGQPKFFEAAMQKQQLSKKEGGDVAGSSWARWEGENGTGRVAAYASFPAPLDKQRNAFWVSFHPAIVAAIPAPLLSHLLSRARQTAISSGDSLEVKLPAEETAFGCRQTYTLRIGITTGALVGNTLDVSCPVNVK